MIYAAEENVRMVGGTYRSTVHELLAYEEEVETCDDEEGESHTLVVAVAVAEIYDAEGDELCTWEEEVVTCNNKMVLVLVDYK